MSESEDFESLGDEFQVLMKEEDFLSLQLQIKKSESQVLVSDKTKGAKLHLMNPVQLISTGESGTDLILNREALKLIEAEPRPITVLSIFGPARKGKSSLLNAIIQAHKGFDVSSTVKAETKGIWFHKGEFPGNPNRCLIVLDTEGISDLGKCSTSHDLNLFTLTLLMSSMFIYSTPGNIDTSATDTLDLATRISSDLVSDDFHQYFPHFVWALRDFYLKLNIEGVELTPDQYMEHCLSQRRNDQNQTMLDVMKEFFPDLSCFLFTKPVEDEKLAELETIPFENLKKPFTDAVKLFRQFIREKAKTKTINGKKLTGFEFAKLIEDLVTSVRSNDLDIRSTHDYVLQEKARNDVRNLFQKFRRDLTQKCNIEEIDKSFFKDIVQAYELHVFNQRSAPDVTSVRGVLRGSLRSPLIRMHKAREAVVETFLEVAAELDGEKVSKKQKILKVCGRVASIAGGGLAVAGAAVAIAATAGAAAPLALPLGAAGASVAVAGGGLQAGGSFYGRKRLKAFEKKFEKVLKVDEVARSDLKAAIENLCLESGLKESARRKIPEDMSEIISQTAQKISCLISKEGMEAKKAAEATTTTGIKAGAGAAAGVIPILDNVAVGVVRTVSVASKVVGGAAIGLSGIFMIWDSVGIYRDVTAKSISDYLREIAEKAEATLSDQIKKPEE